METRISFPAGAVGPGMFAPFLVASMRPGQGGVTGYGGINVSQMPNNQRVGPVRSPIGEVHGYRDQTRALGPVTYIPTNIPGPIYPGVGPGSWHVGPTVVRDGRLPLGTYASRVRRSDARFRTYGAPYGADAGKGDSGLLAGGVLLSTYVVVPVLLAGLYPDVPYAERLAGSVGLLLATGFLLKLAKVGQAPVATK